MVGTRICGGRVYDALGRRLAPAEVLVRGERIEAVSPGTAMGVEDEVLDARGQIVSPGLVDLHTHLGFEIHTQVVAPDEVCPPAGVTTAADLGSTGAYTFPWYRQRVLERAVTRLRAYLNIAALGTIAIHTPYYVENYGRYIDEAETRRTIMANRPWVAGIKVFCTSAMTGCWALQALQTARRVADDLAVPLIVHVSEAPPALAEVLALLRAGDVLTHCYTPHSQRILDDGGRVRAEVWCARQRGVLFDLGHGAGSFAFDVARRALDQGFAPDTLSTDLYHANRHGPVFDLPTTLTKFLALGMPLEEVLHRATRAPALALGERDLGLLVPGAPADVALLEVSSEPCALVDCVGETMQAELRLVCRATLRAGRLVYRREAPAGEGEEGS